MNVLTVLEVRSARSRCHQGWCLVRVILLAIYLNIFTGLLLFALVGREHKLWSLPLLIRTPVVWDHSSTLKTSLNFSYGPKGLVQM